MRRRALRTDRAVPARELLPLLPLPHEDNEPTHPAAASAQGRVPREGFTLLQGAQLVETYRPEGGMVKAFCRVCGSSLFGGTWPDGPEVSIRLGTLDDDPGIRPQYHSYAAGVPPWDRLPDDSLPRYEGPPPRTSVASESAT